MTGYLDVFIEVADLTGIDEGSFPGQIYAREAMTDPTDATPILYLCRLTEAQYQHLVAEGIPFATWATLGKDGKKAKLVRKIKDRDAKDKDIPVLVFGGALRSPGSQPIIPDTSPQATTSVMPEPARREEPKEEGNVSTQPAH